MSDSYDLLVVGAGTAAMVASMRVRAAGWRVAVFDSRPLGGTCALRGCEPKKMLIGGTSAVDHARRMARLLRPAREPSAHNGLLLASASPR